MTKNSIKFPDYISWSLLCNEIFVYLQSCSSWRGALKTTTLTI